MTRDEKFKLRRRTTRRELWNRVAEIPNLPIKLALLAVYLWDAVYVQGKQKAADAFMETLALPAPLIEDICQNLLLSYLLVGVVAFMILLVYPFDRKMVADQFQSIGLANTAGLVPKLLRKRRDKDHPGVTIWEFNNPSLPLKKWMDKQLASEAALDINIINMKYGKSKSRIIVHAVPAKDDLPEHIE